MSPFIELSVIFAAMVLSHQANNMHPSVKASLVSTSDDPNGTHPCVLSGEQNSTVQNCTIWGNTAVDCTVTVNVLLQGRVYLEVIDGQMVGTDYLYVERLGYEGVCKRFVAYTNCSNQDTLCPISFSQSNLTIQFRGNITLQFTALSLVPDADLGQNDCEDFGQTIEVGTHEGQMPSCQEAKGYNQVITCRNRVRDEIWITRLDWSHDTWCNGSCAMGCNCTLGDREVIQECLNDEHTITKQSSIMIFPTDVSNLNLSHSGLSTLDRRAFVAIGKKIERLDLGFNKLFLEVGMFQNLVNLLELGLTDNGLTGIPRGAFIGQKSLQQLWLYRNSLTVLEDGVFDGLRDLEFLMLRDNELSSIQVGSLANLTRLRRLWINDNKLTVLQDGLFEGLGDLETLSLRDNELASIQLGSLANLSTLLTLWLNSNKLTVLKDGIFDGLGNLETLVLWGNELASIQLGSLAKLTRLRELWLHNNKISVLEDGIFDGLGNLEKLSLWDNELAIIQTRTFQGLSRLRSLFLDVNKLVHLNMVTSGKMCLLRNFAANNNTLTTLHPDTFECMTVLKYLFLYQNKLTYLDSRIFKGLGRLKELILADNCIRSLPDMIFTDLLNLHLLDLKNNELQEVPQTFYMTNLMEMKITGNPLKWITSQSFYNLTTSVQIYVDQPEVCLCYATNFTRCDYSKPLSQYFTCDQLLSENAGVIVMFILGFGGIFGNSCVLIKKLMERGENKVQSLLIGNLAMSDLLMGIYMIIVASADVYYGQYFPINSETWRKSNLCRSAGAIAVISSEASVIFITLISIDRFICIRYPYTLHKLRVKSTCLTALVTWIFTLIIGVIASTLAGVNADFYDNSHVCIGLPFVQIVDYQYKERNISSSRPFERLGNDFAAVDTVRSTIAENQSPGLYFSVALFLGFNLVCVLTIIFCYAVLLKTVSESSQKVGRRQDMKEQIELTTKVTAIVMTDVCCWLPVILMGIVVQSGAVELEPQVYAWTVMFVLPFNSTINPFLYTYRTVIYERWKKWRNKRKERANKKLEMDRKIEQQKDLEAQPIKGEAIEELKIDSYDTEKQQVKGQNVEDQQVRVQDVQKQRVRGQDVEEQTVIGGQDKEERQFGGQDIRERRVGDKDVEEQRVSGQNVEEQRVRGQDVEEQGIGSQDVEEKRVRDQDLEEQRVGCQDVEEQRVIGQDVEEQRIGGQDVEEQRVIGQDVEEQRVRGQDVEEQGIGSRFQEEQRARGQDVEKQRIRGQDVEEQRVRDQDLEEQRVGCQDVEEQRVIGQDVEEHRVGGQNIEKHRVIGQLGVEGQQVGGQDEEEQLVAGHDVE